MLFKMKPIQHTFLYLCALSLPLIAIEPPNKKMPVPPKEVEPMEAPSINQAASPEAAPMRKMQDAGSPKALVGHPYVGIKLSPVPEELSSHLGLEKLNGALVRLVAPDSPAKEAGLQEFDIIQSIDGANIRGHDCMCEILKKKKLGDKLYFSILRRGQNMNLFVTLGSRPEKLAAQENPADCEEDPAEKLFDNVPERYAPGIRKLLEQNSRAMGGLGGSSALDPSNDDDMLDLKKRTERVMAEMLRMQKRFGALDQNQSLLQMLPQGGVNMQMAMKSRISVMDANGRIEINRHGDKSEASVYDSEGNLEWSGPFANDEDKKSIPPKVLDRLNQLNLQVDGASRLEMKWKSDE